MFRAQFSVGGALIKRQTFNGDAVIVGAGFAGMYMLYRLRALGLRSIVVEAGGGVGGTWYWNRYPGARCDVESVQYSYAFCDELQQDWDWSERYASQSEILRYANHVADRFDLRRDIVFEEPIERAEYDKGQGLWRVEGSDSAYVGRFLILATGCLSSPNTPPLVGEADYQGHVLHTGRWPHESVDFAGKNVALIGTGSSAIQATPVIAKDAKRLNVFQRTANFAVPAHNRPLDDAYRDGVKADYPALRALARSRRTYIAYAFNPQSALDVDAQERQAVYEDRWQTGGLGFTASFADQITNQVANEYAADFVRSKIRGIVRDPEKADLLSPKSVIGCKRLCVEGGYYEAFNAPNVDLIDIRKNPIQGLSAHGVMAGGIEYPADIVVMATGFDAMTGSILKVDIRGPGGALAETWRDGPVNYLGLGINGFPNLFTITGPGSPSVLSNMLMSIEQHVEWIAACIAAMRENGHGRIEATPQAQTEWVGRVREIADGTLFPTCNSWYLGANIPGKKRVFMPYVGCPPYRETCDRIAREGYAGFALSA